MKLWLSHFCFVFCLFLLSSRTSVSLVLLCSSHLSSFPSPPSPVPVSHPGAPAPRTLSKVPSRPHYEEKSQEGGVQKEHMQLIGLQQSGLYPGEGCGEGRGMTPTDVRLKTCEPPALSPSPSPAASVNHVHSPDVHPGPRMCTYISRGILNLALSSSMKCVCVCVCVCVCYRSVVSNSATPWTNPPGSSVHEILQARILEWVAISFFICNPMD